MAFLVVATELTTERINDHLHQPQLVAPSGAGPITVTAGAGAWTLGAFSSNFLNAAWGTNWFDLHWVDISNISANDDYELVFYYGNSDTEACRIAFTRTGVQVTSFQVHLQTNVLPAGSRVRAKLMSGAGSNSCNAKLFYHTYTG